MMKTATLVLTCLLSYGCAGPGFGVWPTAPKSEPKPSYSKTETQRVEPRIVRILDAEGKAVVGEIAFAEERTYAVNATPPVHRASFWGWLLSRWWAWLLLVLFIAAPGAFIGIAKIILSRFKKGTAQIVEGVERYLNSDAPREAKDKLLQILSTTYDKDTKKLVNEIKNK
jgi:hypothetical protein